MGTDCKMFQANVVALAAPGGPIGKVNISCRSHMMGSVVINQVPDFKCMSLVVRGMQIKTGEVKHYSLVN